MERIPPSHPGLRDPGSPGNIFVHHETPLGEIRKGFELLAGHRTFGGSAAFAGSFPR